MNIKALLFFLKLMKIICVVLILGATSCTRHVSTSTSTSTSIFRVGIRGLPKRLDPRGNEVNIFHYINTHVYYPLIEINRFGQVVSHFLDMNATRATGGDFKSYQLCLKDELKFVDDSPVFLEHLIMAIKGAHSKNMELPPLLSSKISGNCIDVTLSEKEPRYFHKLTSIVSTVLKEEPSEKVEVPVGLGPYNIVSYTKSRIVLVRPGGKDVAHGINRLEFIKMETPEEGLKLDIHDWNHLWQHLGSNAPIPQSIKDSWRKFEQNLVRSLVVVVHTKNESLGRKIISCFNAKKYAETLGLSVSEIPGFLPSGLAGSDVSFNEIKGLWKESKTQCSATQFGQKLRTIPFYVFYPTLEPLVRDFFEKTKNTFPIEVKVVGVTLEEAIKHILGSDELMIATMADTMKVSPTGFFMPFLGKEKIILNKIPGLEETVRAAALAHEDQVDSLFAKAHRMLLTSGTVIPLGQVRAVYYYPPFIKNIPVVEPANGFPRLDQVEVF